MVRNTGAGKEFVNREVQNRHHVLNFPQLDSASKTALRSRAPRGQFFKRIFKPTEKLMLSEDGA
jgi:hypothetical protein